MIYSNPFPDVKSADKWFLYCYYLRSELGCLQTKWWYSHTMEYLLTWNNKKKWTDTHKANKYQKHYTESKEP